MDRFTQAILGYKEEVVVASGGQTFVAATFLSIPANVCLIRLLYTALLIDMTELLHCSTLASCVSIMTS